MKTFLFCISLFCCVGLWGEEFPDPIPSPNDLNEELSPLGELLQDTVFSVNLASKGGAYGTISRGENFFATFNDNLLWVHDKETGQKLDSIETYKYSEYHKLYSFAEQVSYAKDTRELFFLLEDTIRAFRLPSLEMTYENKMIDTFRVYAPNHKYRMYFRDVSADGTTLALGINYEKDNHEWATTIVYKRGSGEFISSTADYQVEKYKILLSPSGRRRAELFVRDTGQPETSKKWVITDNETGEILDEIPTTSLGLITADLDDNPVIPIIDPITRDKSVIYMDLDDYDKDVYDIDFQTVTHLYPLNSDTFITVEEYEGDYYGTWLDIRNNIKGGRYIGDYSEFIYELEYSFLSDDNRLYKGSSSSGNIFAIQLDGDFGSVMNKIMTLTGVEESVSKVSIYPNPSSDILNFSINPSITNSIAEVYDMSGRLVLSADIILSSDIGQIDISTLQPGAYILKLGNYSVAFVKGE